MTITKAVTSTQNKPAESKSAATTPDPKSTLTAPKSPEVAKQSETKPIDPLTFGLPKPSVITLKALCVELKLDPRIAREKLRIAAREGKKYPELAKAHKPRGAWEWVKGSEAEKEARAALAA